MEKIRAMTLSEKLNKVPPWFCRLMATKNNGYKPMSHSDIAKKAGMARSTVIKISRMLKWDGLTVSQIEGFTSACGVNLISPGNRICEFRRSKNIHILKASPDQKKMLLSLMSIPKNVAASVKDTTRSTPGP